MSFSKPVIAAIAGLRGSGRPRTGGPVRSARRRGRRGARRVLPARRDSADRRRHDPAAALDRTVARAGPDSDRPRGECAGSARLRARQSRRRQKARRAPRPNSWPPNWPRFPQAALLADRRSALENSTLDDFAEALRREGAGGYQAVFDEGVAGAARFAERRRAARRHARSRRRLSARHAA